MAEMKTPSSFDGVDHDPTSAADTQDAGGGGDGMGRRAPAAGFQTMIEEEPPGAWPRGAAVLEDAEAASAAGDTEGGAGTAKTVETVLGKHPLPLDEALAALRPDAGGDGSTTFFFRAITASGDSCHVARAWAEVFSAALPPAKMTEACTAGFATCCGPDPRQFLCGISIFFAYGAEVAPKELIGLATVLTLEELKGVFLGGVACVDNPFIPGVSFSVALEEALKISPQREKPILTALQESVDDLILEILERLPQSIADFPGGVKGCEDVFEPEIAGIVRDYDFRGPLRLALQERQFSKTLCVSPLMCEYMSYRFVAGLPNLQDSNNLLGRPKKTAKVTTTTSATTPTSKGESRASAPTTEATAATAAATTTAVSSLSERESRKGRDFLYDDGFVADSKFGKLMQGLGWTGWAATPRPTFDSRPTSRDWERIFHGTVLPGLQFITIGVLTRPTAYYKVPAIRMALSFYVHLVMLALYTTVVLEDDDGELSNTEIVLTFYVLAEIVSNLVQIWDDFFEYVRNKWNWLECLSLLLLAGGLFVRVVDSDVHLGRALFALSAPLVFSRVLFFGQILRRQGLVIQMIAILFGEMLQFGLVLGTIMMGFTVSFFALFSEYKSYGECWLDVFKAMLGEVGVFEELYEDSVYRDVAKILLVLYLIVVAVMLLNLLIAVLSTEHAKVEQQQDRAFRESKVRIMKLYGRMVEGDQLPTPFNLLQLALWLPFSVLDRLFGVDTSAKIVHEFGVGIAWLMLGPPALLAAWGLWVVSVPAAVLRVWRRANFTGKSLTFAVVCSSVVVALHTLVLPFVALLFWGMSGLDLLVTVTRELAASLCGNDAAGGDRDDTGGRDDHRRARRGAADVSGASSDGGSDAVGLTSVAQILKEGEDTLPAAAGRRVSLRGGGGGGESGLSVADIVAYLEDPETNERREQQEQAATWEQIIRMRNQLDDAGKARSEAVLTRLARVDADLKASVVELVERSVARGVERGLRDGLEKTVAEMVEERVAAVVERRQAPPRASHDRQIADDS